MNVWLITQLDYLLRIFVAAGCGAAIGYERENRLKTAGIRTHIVVSIGAALMMVVSKYGFFDVIVNASVNLDPSRIASGIVTAIGFLGAGVIMVQNRTVSGVTTAAGVWTTVGIGMAVGAGMYFLGVTAALLVVTLQMLLHRHFHILKTPVLATVVFRLEHPSEEPPLFVSRLRNPQSQVHAAVRRLDGESLEVELQLRLLEDQGVREALSLLQSDPRILSVELR